jgi:hypothetical protein
MTGHPPHQTSLAVPTLALAEIGQRVDRGSRGAVFRGALVATVLAAMACGDSGAGYNPPEGPLPFEPIRPDRDDPADPAPYTGSDPIVLAAQEEYRTGLDLHVKVIRRTCSPTEGVCHNTKEYPDLHTAENVLAAVDAPCNVQAGTREAIFDRCERPGDRFALDTDAVRSGPIEIGNLRYVPGERPEYSESNPPGPEAPGLHVALADPIVTDRTELWAQARFIRTFVDPAGLVQDISYRAYTTRWWVVGNGRELVGEVNDWQIDEVRRLLEVGVVEGDPNLNGVFGARVEDPVSLLVPGAPEASYLIARVRGVMEGEAVPGTRMPLANQPLSNAELLALYCFVEGLGTTPTSRLDRAIDYATCSYSADPENLDLGTESQDLTWAGKISSIFESNCGGCHDAETPSADLPLVGEQAYDALLLASEGSSLPRVTPSDPSASYVWLKLTNAADIDGSPMPTSPLTGWRPLTNLDLDAIRTWIERGAPRD